ncbi:formate dehydrogenase accessory sulfurtransferase FdhD [Neptunomonas japonica]|uniref:Sulfur carrier protein FdhD n=1 Tax=Neptunomonas japonica JAMM 1380 TaxID=1441457 RepID=A0A7R6PNR1_9GAMM|nr:formate dehydrogenase accessory sulfurtransferase FdhD [Neptunomonas japonica]BBB29817.1 FdhD protein [Neptunomonas japonica JAMM 1380]
MAACPQMVTHKDVVPTASESGLQLELQASVAVSRWEQGNQSLAHDNVAEEVAVALVYNGISHVVMMTSPNDLKDFALGFSITEGILTSADELYDIELQQHDTGVEVQMSIASGRMMQLKQQRRNLTGRTGCGLCGAESLGQAVRPIKVLQNPSEVSDEAIQSAVLKLDENQPQQALTGACHGAAWCNKQGEILMVREDVGRHNALDKLIGALVREGINMQKGFVLISSRASYEMVQKVTAVGINTLVAVSAPTGLALRLAREAGLQLIGFARPQRHVSYSPEPVASND